MKPYSLLLTIMTVIGLLIAPGFGSASVAQAQSDPPEIQAPRQIPPARLQQIPAEIQAEFAGGMTAEEFIARSEGRVPQALQSFVDEEITVIVELEAAPLATLYTKRMGTMSVEAQAAHLEKLESVQSTIEPLMEQMGANVISRYQKAYNGFLTRVPTDRIAEIQSLPGVKDVHRAPEHHINLSKSVPLIGTDEVWNSLGYDGDGVTIAVIDTGIDYYHEALGGSGDPNDYANDNREVIEPGSFPTAKVIGGYDFAGPDYDASSDDPAEYTPTPDPDPLDFDGHGTHVASTAAGVGATGVISPGVAPGAKLYALKVFGEPAGSTNLTLDAIEWSMDPNGDGDMSDHVDVINMSLGSNYGPNDLNDPEIVAVNNASALGVIVVSSAGNAGDTSYILGSPAAADSAIAVAASTTGYATGPTIDISGTTYMTQTGIIYQPPAFDDNTGHFTQTTTAPLFYVGTVTTDTLCTTAGVTTDLSDHIALIQRGDCAFSTKVNNAASLGAIGAIIFNHTTGGNSRSTMVGDPVTIPAGFIAHDDGMNLVPAHLETAIVSAEDDVSTVIDPYTPVDSAATFTSRGPRGFDSYLKPDVTAPGVGIFAAAVGTGSGGVSYSGTSMAAPHVAGAAALLREAHPSWTPEQVKAAMMNTAVDLADDSPIPIQGAGRVETYEAATTEALAIADEDLVSLNWGVVPIGSDSFVGSKNITLRELAGTTKVYSVTVAFHTDSFTEGVSLNLPSTVTLPANGMAAVSVIANIDATQLPNAFMQLEEYYGYIHFINTTTPTDTLRLPFYLVPRPYSQLTEVSSSTSFDYSTGMATFDLRHTGPISSSVWAYPVYAVDGNETMQGDEGDVRLVGMDYGGLSPYGDIVVPAINTWGTWHTPQPYFAEFDLYLDADEDGVDDYVIFNFNYGWFQGQDDNDLWIPIQVDLSTGSLDLASPYSIYTDYNAGFMEWYLPATWNGLEDIAPDANTDFDFQLIGFDYEGNSDMTEAGSFDYARYPFAWGTLSGPNNPGPANRETTYGVMVNDLGGYLYSQPKGVMLVDYNSEPGMGQAYYWSLNVTGYPKLFLPIIFMSGN